MTTVERKVKVKKSSPTSTPTPNSENAGKGKDLLLSQLKGLIIMTFFPVSFLDSNRKYEVIDQLGYIAAMKDGFGFLETSKHDKEIFFHFSNLNGNPDRLEVGAEVKYSIYSR